MKTTTRILMALSLVTLLCVTAWGQGAIFSVKPTSIAFGSVNTGTGVTDSVTVTNTGTANLLISNVSSDNTQFTVTPRQANIAPSASRKFYITFSPMSAGLHSANIVFSHSLPVVRDTVVVTGTGVGPTVQPVFTITPTSINFGDVNTGSNKRDSVTVTNTGTYTLQISNTLSNNNRYTVTPKTGNLAPAASMKFYITFAPTAPGTQKADISFIHNAANGKDSIPVTGNGVGAAIEPIFSVAPTSINFGDVNTGQVKQDSVTVTNTGTANLIITMVSSGNSHFTVTPGMASIAPAGTRKFYISYAPTAPGAESTHILFMHNASNGKDSILVNGAGVGSAIEPIFSIAPTSLDFGDVNPGGVKTDSVFVTNTGTANLVISKVASSNARFTISPQTATITPGAKRKFTITFSPQDVGAQSGFISFTHNAATAKDSIPVTGKGAGNPVEPVFSIAPTSLDFGDVNPGGMKSDSVFVTNTGTANLIISKVGSSNARFTFSPQTATIAPGAKRKFTITFSPQDVGVQSGFISFTHNAATAKDSIPVTGKGAGEPLQPVFSVDPTKLDFGDVNTGSVKTDSVVVTNKGTANLVISKMTSRNPRFTVTPQTANIAPAATRKFYITFAPTAPGKESGEIVWTHNAKNGSDSISVAGNGVGGPVEANFSVVPKNLEFGDVNTGSNKTDSVTVTNTGTAALNISNTASDNPMFTITPRFATIAASASRKFYITFAPSAPGKVNANVVFTHNGKTGKDTVTVGGNGVGTAVEPTFTVTPQILNFGAIDTGTTKRDSVTVVNTGTANLMITNVVSSNTHFTVAPKTSTITPGSSRKFYVTYAPTTVGSESGSIHFTHNAVTSPDSIMVYGTGNAIGEEPRFSAKPTKINFGVVNSGLSKVDSITVTNNGKIDLVISTIQSTNNYFTVYPGMGTVAPSKSKTFYVTFAPWTDQKEAGYIIFNHNAPSAKDSVSVVGNELKVIPLSQARSLPNGSEVVVEGIVTRTKGTLTRIQDLTGALTIRQTAGPFFDMIASGEIRMGDLIRLYGKITETAFLKQFGPNDLIGGDRLSRDNPLPTPQKLTLAEIAANGEQYESQLITVTGLTIDAAGDTDFAPAKIYKIIDDSDKSNAVGLRIMGANDTDTDGKKIPTGKAVFTGVLGQQSLSNPNQGYQLIPVLADDVMDMTTGIEDYLAATPDRYVLHGNYPNPFNPSTTILYSLPLQSRITLRIFNVLGEEIATLVNAVQESGNHYVDWNACDANGKPVAGGVYFYKLHAEPMNGGTPFISVNKMILLQ